MVYGIKSHLFHFLVIACPTQKRLTVMLTDWLRNSTIGEIVNEDDTVRRLTVSNVEVVLVRQSLEYFDPMYR